MIKLRFTNSIEIKVDRPSSNYSELLVDSLKSIGFKDITVNSDLIEFKSDNNDQILESFQRRYGDGKISFKTTTNSVVVTSITNSKRSFMFSLLSTVLLIIILFSFGLSTDKKINDLILFVGALIISFILSYFIDSSLTKHKQKGLLDLINEKIKIASH
jgi:ATP-dependent Zn protease